MKILSKLNINREKILRNEELVNLRGGGHYVDCESPLQEWYCECTGSVGAWYGCYLTADEAYTYVASVCASGTGACGWA